jgi:hypothetical protein
VGDSGEPIHEYDPSNTVPCCTEKADCTAVLALNSVIKLFRRRTGAEPASVYTNKVNRNNYSMD